MLKLISTTATPFSQINSASDGLIETKKLPVFIDIDGKKHILRNPIVTGDSINGMLRRESMAILVEKAVEKNIKSSGKNLLSEHNFQLMNAGGGNNYAKQETKVVEKVRELNPVISVFGASLAVEGKTRIPHMIPLKTPNTAEFDVEDTDKYFMNISYEKDNEGKIREPREVSYINSPIVIKEQIIKKDDLLDKRGNAKIMTLDQVVDWEEYVNSDRTKKATAKKTKEKVNSKAIATKQDREIVVTGVDFYGHIGEKLDFSEIEYGMLVKAVEKFVLLNQGSNKSRNFGLFNHKITFDDGGSLEVRVNNYLEPEIVKKDYKEKTLKAIEAFENWLEDLTEENLQIAEIMTETSS